MICYLFRLKSIIHWIDKTKQDTFKKHNEMDSRIKIITTEENKKRHINKATQTIIYKIAVKFIKQITISFNSMFHFHKQSPLFGYLFLFLCMFSKKILWWLWLRWIECSGVKHNKIPCVRHHITAVIYITVNFLF